MTIFLTVLAAVVQSAVNYPPDTDCQEAGDGSTYAMAQCFTAPSNVWDTRLNAEYQAALKFAEVKRRSLVKAQRAWLLYRDANCEAYYTVNGSIRTILAGKCWRDMTRDRTLELQQMAWTG